MTKMTYALALELALANLSADSCEYTHKVIQPTEENRMNTVEVTDVVPMSEVKDKLTALLASLEKKASAEKKPTAKQKEAAEVAQTLLAQLKENGNALTVSEMIAQLPVCEGMSNQKVSALVRSLGSAVERVEEKRKAYFRAV